MQATGSLYFHIPFCTKKCPYCHFYVIPDKDAYKKILLDGLQKEWQSNLPLIQERRIVSIYFGGGTPALFGPNAIGEILSWTGLAPEITIETNPENTTYELMKAYADLGINRVSIGVQSLDDSALNLLERRHNAETALRALENTAKAGISNISLDLMYDLPYQTISSWKNTLSKLKDLPITHVSLYNLTFEPNTSFFKRQKQLKPHVPMPDASLEMLNTAVIELENLGFKRYEISAFAKPGYESIHNTGYWQARPFLGYGPSAFSYWDKKRFRNVPDLNKYAQALNENRSPVDFEELLPYPDDLHELLAVRLRMLDGVDLSSFEEEFGKLPSSTYAKLSALVQKGWLTQTGPRAALSPQGLLFYDSLASELI